MATTGEVFGDYRSRSVTMDSDLSAKAGYAVNLDTTDENNVNLASGATAFPFVLLEGYDGSSAKQTGAIARPGSTVLAKLGGTVAPGDKLTSNGSGLWITTVTNHDHYGAIAMQIGAANDEIEVEVALGTVSA